MTMSSSTDDVESCFEKVREDHPGGRALKRTRQTGLIGFVRGLMRGKPQPTHPQPLPLAGGERDLRVPAGDVSRSGVGTRAACSMPQRTTPPANGGPSTYATVNGTRRAHDVIASATGEIDRAARHVLDRAHAP